MAVFVSFCIIIFVKRRQVFYRPFAQKSRRTCKMKDLIFKILIGALIVIVAFYALVLVTGWL